MKMRTTNAPARIASGTTSHQESTRVRYIPYQSAAYGTRVLLICQSARGVEGRWNWTTICFHAAGSIFPLLSELFMNSRLPFSSETDVTTTGIVQQDSRSKETDAPSVDGRVFTPLRSQDKWLDSAARSLWGDTQPASSPRIP